MTFLQKYFRHPLYYGCGKSPYGMTFPMPEKNVLPGVSPLVLRVYAMLLIREAFSILDYPALVVIRLCFLEEFQAQYNAAYL